MDELKLEGESLELKPSVSWELTDPEIIFPLVIGQHEIRVHMRPYGAADLQKLLRDLNYRITSRDVQIVDVISGDTSAAGPFFWKYFITLTGLARADDSVPSQEEVEDWIKSHPRFAIERNVILHGFGGVRVEEEPPISLLDVGGRVHAWQSLYCPALNCNVKMDMYHVLQPETELDIRRYNQAIGQSRIHTRRSEWERIVNYGVIESLYNATIIEIIGMTVNGSACTAVNKDTWVKLVPFWHKEAVIGTYFRGVSVKNE